MTMTTSPKENPEDDSLRVFTVYIMIRDFVSVSIIANTQSCVKQLDNIA